MDESTQARRQNLTHQDTPMMWYSPVCHWVPNGVRIAGPNTTCRPDRAQAQVRTKVISLPARVSPNPKGKLVGPGAPPAFKSFYRQLTSLAWQLRASLRQVGDKTGSPLAATTGNPIDGKLSASAEGRVTETAIQ